MHICLAIDASFVGGGHLHVLSLAKAIRDQGDKVTVINTEAGPFSRLLEENGIPVCFVPMGKVPGPLKIFAWRRALETLAPDILHLHGAVAGFWGRFTAPPRRPYRILYTVHGIQFIHRPNPIARRIFQFSERLMRDRGEFVLCVSASDALDAVRLGIARKDQVRLVSNGISLAQPVGARLSRSAWGIPPDAFVVGCVGRLTAVKGQKYAIEAVARLKVRYPHLHLVLAGVGEEHDALEGLARKLGLSDRVHLVGFVKQPVAALQLLDIHLFPSLWEGQGIVLMEAMLAGTPSIASNVNGIPEVIRNGKEGLLVPRQDSESLANAIEALIKDPELRRRLGESGRERVKMFDEKKTLKLTLDLYRPEPA